MPYANEYGPHFHIFDYTKSTTPPKTRGESNAIANELSGVRIRIEDEVYSDRLKFPGVSTQSIDAKYICNKDIEAKTITYTTESNGRKEVVKNGQLHRACSRA